MSNIPILLPPLGGISTPPLGYESPPDPFHPGGASMSGFLAPNETLEEVIARDKQTLRRYGVTCQEIAAKLTEFVDKFNQQGDALAPQDQKLIEQYPIYSENLNIDTFQAPYGTREARAMKRVIDHRYIMGQIQTAGWQECPFGDLDFVPGNDYFIYDTQTGGIIEFGLLLIHLIEVHCFFEGNVQYRLDPERVIKFFGLDRQHEWRMMDYVSNPDTRDLTTYAEFRPGVYGRLNGNILELNNITSQPQVVPEMIVNNIVLPTTP